MRLIRDTQVADKLGLKKSSIWNKAKADPAFPQPIKLPNSHRTAWVEEEVDAYVRKLIADHRNAVAA